MLLFLAQADGMSMAEAQQAIGVQNFGDFIELTRDIWSDGGWLMGPLFALAVFIFFEAVSLVMRLDRAKLSMPFWWGSLTFLSVAYIIISVAAKGFVLGLLGIPFDADIGASPTDYGILLAFGIIANPFMWSALLTFKPCKRGLLQPNEWERWVDNPDAGRGYIGQVVQFVVRDGVSEESMDRLEAVRSGLVPDVNQKITVLSSLVTLAPLMGLLGTVIGMLDTFRGLGSSSGQAAELVANGIRVALITTQTGLTIAIPGYIFIALAVRSRNEFSVFLAELGTVVTRRIHTGKKEKGVAA